MNPRAARRLRLRQRLMLAFASFALFVATLYGGYVVLFVYLVEDRFFRSVLQQELVAQQQHRATHGDWARPRLDFVSLHPTAATLPEDVRAALLAQPWRGEFAAADGRHYHLQPLPSSASTEPAWLLAEVSQQLAVRPMRGEILRWLGGSSLLVLALALLVGAWLARRLTAPLSRLAGLMENIHPLHLPSELSSHFVDDEVGTLARALDRLIGRIEDFVNREREFTRDASHELRTPLTVIRSSCERLAENQSLDAATRLQLDHIRRSAQQLEQTVSTLLLLAREEHNLEPATDFAILPLLERVVIEQAPLLEDRPVTVRVNLPLQTRTRLPATVFRIVLSNLIGNAFAHTRAGTVTVDIDGDWLRVCNSANGIVADAFQAFFSAGDNPGFGLGLTIIARLSERHGIGLDFITDQPAQSEFTIARIRLTQSPIAAATAEQPATNQSLLNC